MSAKLEHRWTPQQIKYIEFVSRGKTNLKGEKRTDDEFAKAVGVGRTTLWRWQNEDGFAEAIFEQSLKNLIPYLPSLNVAMLGKASGSKKHQGASERAYLALMRQYELLKTDKVDITTKGKELPTPILGGLAAIPQSPTVAQSTFDDATDTDDDNN